MSQNRYTLYYSHKTLLQALSKRCTNKLVIIVTWSLRYGHLRQLTVSGVNSVIKLHGVCFLPVATGNLRLSFKEWNLAAWTFCQLFPGWKRLSFNTLISDNLESQKYRAKQEVWHNFATQWSAGRETKPVSEIMSRMACPTCYDRLFIVARVNQ